MDHLQKRAKEFHHIMIYGGGGGRLRCTLMMLRVLYFKHNEIKSITEAKYNMFPADYGVHSI